MRDTRGCTPRLGREEQDEARQYEAPYYRDEEQQSDSSSDRGHALGANKTSLDFIMNYSSSTTNSRSSEALRAAPSREWTELSAHSSTRLRSVRSSPRIAARLEGLLQAAIASLSSVSTRHNGWDSPTLAQETDRAETHIAPHSIATVVPFPQPLAAPARGKRPRKPAGTSTQSAKAKAKSSASSSASKAKPMSYEEKRRSRECRVDGCEKYIINKGLCFHHGGGKKCAADGCTSSAKNNDRCWKHGGSIKCSVDGCRRCGKSRGLCWAHGGGTKCSDVSCSKVAVSNGYCWAHGGGKRCAFEGCNKAAYERTYNYCSKHHNQLKDGNVTLEV